MNVSRTGLAVAVAGVLVLGLVMSARPGSAQSADLQALQREIQALRQEIGELKALLQQALSPRDAAQPSPAAAPADVTLSLDGAPQKGRPDATVTLVEFSDYQCPYCASYARTTLTEIEREYVERGKLRYVFMDFPIESLHPAALQAHEAAACAGDQGQYWQMHARLFEQQSAVESGDLAGQARAIGLDGPRFAECLASDRHAAALRDRIAAGQKLGVRGTPTFLIGIVEPGTGRFRARRVISGAQPFATFKAAIDDVLAAQE